MTIGLLLIAVYMGMTWRQTRQQRVNHELIAAVRRLDVAGTEEALHDGANPNARSSPDASSRFLQWLKRWYRSDVSPLTTETALNEALIAHSSPYKNASVAEDTVKTRIVQLLLDAGANPNTPYTGGYMPLVTASGECSTPIVRLLLAHHTDVNRIGSNKMPALTMAALYNRPDTIRLLLARGADVNARDKHGLTALMCASANDYVAVETLLLNFQANATVADVNGTTALQYALRGNRTASVHLLRQHGATK